MKEEYNSTGTIYYREDTGNLKIKDDKKFIKLIMLNDEDAYKALEIYAKKILKDSYPDVPYEKYDDIVLIAIAKALHGYNPDKGAGILTYLTSKIRGEVSDWRYQKNADERKVIKEVNNNRDNYMFQSTKDSNEITVLQVTNETPEEKIIEEDIYTRQLKAFRMAYSQLPMFLQYILNRLVMEHGDEYIDEEKGKVRKKKENYITEVLAKELNLAKHKVTELRNFALSLILIKVLRSTYLTEEEKNKIKEIHGLNEDEIRTSINEGTSKIDKALKLAQKELEEKFSPEELAEMKKIDEEINTYLGDKALSISFDQESKEEIAQAKIDFDIDFDNNEDF